LPTTGTTTEHYKDYALESGVDASLTHSRARVDLRMMADTAWQEEASENQADGAKAAQAALNAERDKIESLALWSTPLVVTTADTVLGLMSNARRSIYTLPAIMSAGPAAATYYRKLPFPFHMMRLEWQSLVDSYTRGSPYRRNDLGSISRVRFSLCNSFGRAGVVCLEGTLVWRSPHGNVSRVPASGFYILRFGTIRLGALAAALFRLSTFRHDSCT
jgi:hypothetical protein